MLKNHHVAEFTKFAVVGGASTLLNYSIFFILYRHAHVHYLTASAMGYATGIIFSYTFNRLWTFKPTMENQKKEFAYYVLVCLVSLSLSLSLLKFEVTVLHITPLVANIFAIGLSAISNFVGLKLFVFAKPPVSQEIDQRDIM